MKMTTHYLQIERNAEGSKLAIISPLDNEGNISSGFRIAGPKAWGGSSTLADIKIDTDDFVRYIKEYAPDIMEALSIGLLKESAEMRKKADNYKDAYLNMRQFAEDNGLDTTATNKRGE